MVSAGVPVTTVHALSGGSRSPMDGYPQTGLARDWNSLRRAVASGAQGDESEIELLEENGIVRKFSFAAADHARNVSLASQSERGGDRTESGQSLMPSDPRDEPAQRTSSHRDDLGSAPRGSTSDGPDDRGHLRPADRALR